MNYSIVANIVAKADQFTKTLNDAKQNTDKFAKNFADKTTKLGRGMQNVGATMSKYITAPLVALGGLAVASANDIDKAMANIRVGTGATGKDLESLGNDFREVFKNVPQSADEVSNALADLNTRTGLTGKPLQDLTKQMLDLSRIAGVDSPTMIAKATRAFGDWDIATKDQSKALDYMWKVSQSTGIGVDDLASKVVQFGSPMRQMGFTFEETAALMGKFEKEGVNTELVMGSMRQALGHFAREGIDTRKGLKQTVDAIKNAGSESEATAIAMEVFGARAGADMASAIREGRFEIDDLIDDLNNSTETIDKAGQESLTFGERLSMIKNKAQLGLEPLGNILLDLAEKWLPKVSDAVERVSEWFSNLSPEGQQLAVIIGIIVAVIPPLIAFLGTLVISAGALAGALGAISLPVVAVIAGIAALIAIGVLLWKNWDTIKEKTSEIWGHIKEFLSNTWESVKEIASKVWSGIVDFFKKTWDSIKETTSKIWNNILSFFSNTWDKIKSVFNNVVSWVVDFVKKRFDNLKNNATSVFNSVRSFISNVWDKIKSVFSNVISWIVDFVKSRFNNVKNNISNIFNGIRTIASNVWNGIKTTISNIVSGAVDIIRSRFNNVKNNISSIFNSIRSTATNVWNRVKNAITNPINTARDNVKKAIDNIKSFFSGLGSKLKIKIPKPKLPKFKLDGSFSLNPPSVPKLSVSWNALGGIFDKPTIFNTANAGLQGVGEAGAEAILPLTKSVLGTIGDKIFANMSHSNMGGASQVAIDNTFYFNVDGDMDENQMKRIAKYVAKEQVKGLKKKGF